jgi:hypothetical protein
MAHREAKPTQAAAESDLYCSPFRLEMEKRLAGGAYMIFAANVGSTGCWHGMWAYWP